MEGQAVSKEIVIKSFRKVVSITMHIYDDDLLFAIKGHSLRVSGAQLLASKGLEVSLIQILGRWGGCAVLRYVADAPLTKITMKYKNCRANEDIGNLRKAIIDAEAAFASSSSGKSSSDMQPIIQSELQDRLGAWTTSSTC